MPDIRSVVRWGCALIICLAVMGLLAAPAGAQDQPEQPVVTLRQWATGASATSQFGESDWSALRVTGAPDSLACGDQWTAWASAEATGVDSLTVTYDIPLVPTQINIYQSYNPGAITGIELVLADGSGTMPVPDSADPGTECPGVLSIDVLDATAPVNGVIIHLDQTITGDWNEIDAVELVGVLEMGSEVSLWASSASATSQYSDTSWSARQVTGAPDSPECADQATAWASETSSGQDVLTVQFPLPVIPTRLDIVQTYNPGAITSVDLILANGRTVPVADSADPGTECPGMFSLALDEPNAVIGAAIHLDQTITGDWSEIDAVSITGAVAGGLLHQWATGASATSQYGTSGWSVLQATGAPDSIGCGDQAMAWASATPTGVDTLTVSFMADVVPTQVNIYQVYNPGAITGIELVLADGSGTVPVPDSADPGTECPGVLSVDVPDATAPVNGVIIHLDQTITGDWNEIDAVELVGTLGAE